LRGPEHHRAFYRARRPQKKKQPVWISLGNNAIKVSEIDQGNASFQSAFADQPSRINLPESTFQNQPSRINLPESTFQNHPIQFPDFSILVLNLTTNKTEQIVL